MNIAFVTSAEWPDLTPDDRLAAAALERRGARVAPAIWTRAQNWIGYDAVVLRSCWDYHQRMTEFRSWIRQLESAGVPMLNPAPTVGWNLDKRYLLDLAASGVPVIDTVVPSPGDRLERIMAERGWARAVLKPRISADAHRTRVVAAHGADTAQAELDALLGETGALVQEYAHEIDRTGELSLVFLNGAYSHAVRKRPASGDFRVQARFGGTSEPAWPDDDLVAQGLAALRAAARPAIYARVDGCVIAGRLVLMELELIEPTLFLDSAAGAADRFAEAVLSALMRRPRRPGASLLE